MGGSEIKTHLLCPTRPVMLWAFKVKDELERLAVQEYPMFHTSDGRKVIENLDEFDDAREVVSSLAAEYQACERPDYVSHTHSCCALSLCSASRQSWSHYKVTT